MILLHTNTPCGKIQQNDKEQYRSMTNKKQNGSDKTNNKEKRAK